MPLAKLTNEVKMVQTLEYCFTLPNPVSSPV